MKNIKDFEAMAKLSFSEAHREWATGCADGLIESFSELDTVEVQDIDPLITVLDVKTVLRHDVAVKQFSTDEILSNAPEQYDGYFQVPKAVN